VSGEFVPFAQPVFSLDTGAITGCEILARWVRRDGTIISPYRFIPLAEETGRIVPLTRRMVTDALSELRPLLSRDAALTVAFNISPSHFLSPEFVEEMCDLVHEAGVSARQIILEITERQELPDLAIAASLIARLGQCGFQVAIDDAGSGHSGLSYLQTLGVQIIKIDKLFVDAVESAYSARVIVEMLVRVAHELGMAVIAEGIERPEQLSWLREIGVDQGQGFLVSAPIPIHEFRSLTEAGTQATPSIGRADDLSARVA
jgi:EAL domain-containing protein (putative c-di-GMP-specific phosphodiesterase class I)